MGDLFPVYSTGASPLDPNGALPSSRLPDELPPFLNPGTAPANASVQTAHHPLYGTSATWIRNV